MTPLDFHLERHELSNGLRVLISENRRLPLLSLTACVVAGAVQNPMDRPGLAALTARLLDEGSAHFSADELARKVENTGGALSTFSQRELSGVSFNLASRHLRLGLGMLAELVRWPAFPRKQFLKERERLLNQVRAAQDDPQQVASHLLSRSVYRGTPLQHPNDGTIPGLRRASLEDVQLFHSTRYAPQNTIVTVVGDVRSRQVLKLIEDRFGDWRCPRFEPPPPLRFNRQDSPDSRQLHMDKEQLHILIGHLGVTRDDPDFHALQLMDVILGSGPGFTSRVPRRLREDQGLAYSTYCDITGSSGICPGRFVAYISTSPKNRDTAVQGLLHEIRKLREDGVAEAELALAQDFLTGGFVFDFQSNADLARLLVLIELFQLGADYPKRYPEIIRGIGSEDVARVAQRHLDTVNYSQVIVGPIRGRHAKN